MAQRRVIPQGSRDRRGVSIALFALSLITIVAFCGLTIDVGHWYHTRARLQAHGDASALGGSVKLGGNGSAQTRMAEADADARKYAGLNGVTAAEIILIRTLPVGADPKQLEVTLERIAGPFFTGALGFQTIRIRTKSVAEISSFTKGQTGNGETNYFPYALQTGREFANNGNDFVFKFAGGGTKVFGDVHVNGDLDFTGGGGVVTGNASAGHDISVGSAVITGTKTENAPRVPLPTLDLDSIKLKAKQAGTYYKVIGNNNIVSVAPDGTETPATAPEGFSFNGRNLHQNGTNANVLGTFYVEGGGVHINGNSPSGTATFVADGEIQINSNGGTFAGTSKFAFISLNTSTSAINISSVNQTLEGLFYTPFGGVNMQGSGNTINGGIAQFNGPGFSGSNNKINYDGSSSSIVPVIVGTKSFVRLIE